MAKRILIMGTLALAAWLLGGCSSTFHEVSTFDVPPGRAIAVDIDNRIGRVEVRAGEDYDVVTVDAAKKVDFGLKRKEREARAEEAILVQSALEEGPGGRMTLRVRSESVDPQERDHRVDLLVTLPRVDGALVRNQRGVVELVGVGGALQVESASHIVVRTNQPLDQPVALDTERGNVYLQMPPGSRGRIELESQEGEVEVSSVEQLDDVFVQRGVHRGVLNRGLSPILLRTGEGNIRLLIRSGAESILRMETVQAPTE